MPPKPKAQGTSKKADAKKKERVIEVCCKILYLPISYLILNPNYCTSILKKIVVFI